MIINPKDRSFQFREGEEALQFLPILVDILRVNNKNKPVRMRHADGTLTVVCYTMTDDEWKSSVKDVKAWHELLDIWKITYKEDLL